MLFLEILSARLENGLQLVQSENWEESGKQQEQREEDTQRSNENADVN